MTTMKGLLIILLNTVIMLSEAQDLTIPLELQQHPYHMDDYYQQPIDETAFFDSRLKRQQKQSLNKRIESANQICVAELAIPEEDVPEDLLNCKNPSPKIKCLMTCILQRLQLMTKNNLISIRGIGQMADEVGNYNPLVTSIAVAIAQQFNDRLARMKIQGQCEAGYLINEFIANEMKTRKVNLPN